MSKADKIQFIIKFLADNEFLGKDTKAIENYHSYYRRGLLTYHEAVSEIYKNMLYGEIKLFYENTIFNRFCTTTSYKLCSHYIDKISNGI